MTDKVTFESLAGVKANEVEAPPIMPAGHYRGIIAGKMTTREAKSGNLGLVWPVKLVEALPDVDEDDLQAAGGITEKPLNMTFWASPSALFLFTEFCEGLGLDTDCTIPELCENLTGFDETFIVQVGHTPNDKNPDRPYVNIDRAMPESAYED